MRTLCSKLIMFVHDNVKRAIVRSYSVVLILAMTFMAPHVSRAGADTIISASEAFNLMDEDNLRIIDVRTPREWQKTGIPAGAFRLTYVRGLDAARNLVQFVREITDNDPTQPVALICAAGVRSNHAATILRNSGFRNVFNIAEGMQGNHHGIGWLAQGLPLDKIEPD